ncbi:MAG: hypothetical protein AAGF90_22745 [Pseudomonadota bacterium]
MARHDPSRGELIFRLWVGAAIVALTLFAIVAKGFGSGPAMAEAAAIGLVFGLGTVIWSLWKLRRRR